MNYEADMRIDEDALEVELLEQPSLVAKYSRLLAEAKRDRDLFRENLDLVRAEINLDIRDNPEKYKLDKLTVDSVNACILMEDDFKKAQKDLNDSNFEVNVLTGVISAIDHRKSALENLVKLFGMDYFAGPAIPHNISDLRKSRLEEAENKIGQKMTRTRKPKTQN